METDNGGVITGRKDTRPTLELYWSRGACR